MNGPNGLFTPAPYRRCRTCGASFRVSTRGRKVYCSDQCAAPASGKVTDRRYHTARWRRTRERVLNRGGKRCFVPSCMALANVADHIVAVHPGMSDEQFFSEANLRAACRRHNLARGFAASLEEPQPLAAQGLMNRGIRFRRPRIG